MSTQVPSPIPDTETAQQWLGALREAHDMARAQGRRSAEVKLQQMIAWLRDTAGIGSSASPESLALVPRT